MEALLRPLSARGHDTSSERMFVIFIGDAASRALASKRPLGFESVAVADTNGTIANRYGIQIRPTIVHVDWDGRVSSVHTG